MKNNQHYDVIVVGGGIGGECAAAAAASKGASTLLIERYGFLGGMATAGLVNPFMSYHCGNLNLTTPVFGDILHRLRQNNALCGKGQVFDDEILKLVLDQMMVHYGVKVFLHSMLCGVETESGQIKRISILTKSGLVTLGATLFIDSTGDGDLASAAAVPFEAGRDEDGACQPMTLCFRASGITGGLDACRLGEELTEILNMAKKRGDIVQPREDVLIFNTLTPGTYHFNTTRILGKMGTCSIDLTDAEIEGRRQVFELMDLFRERSKRFTNAGIVKLACQIGVRETRRIAGRYTITEEDILSARRFPDGIARSCYPVDIHNPTGSGTILKHPPDGQFYEVPFRSLLPVTMKNLVIGSRCISSTHEAHSSLRVMPVVGAIGEAAGLGAGCAILGKTNDLSGIDGSVIKEMLFGQVSEKKPAPLTETK